jgi:hypothetical protein
LPGTSCTYKVGWSGRLIAKLLPGNSPTMPYDCRMAPVPSLSVSLIAARSPTSTYLSYAYVAVPITTDAPKVLSKSGDIVPLLPLWLRGLYPPLNRLRGGIFSLWRLKICLGHLPPCCRSQWAISLELSGSQCHVQPSLSTSRFPSNVNGPNSFGASGQLFGVPVGLSPLGSSPLTG